MRVLMTGGGTAGHVNPAIAIANTIKKYDPEAEIAFVCSSQRSDKAQDLVTRAGYELYRVNICGSYQIWNPKNIKTLILMAVSAGQARKLIGEFKPDVIIGTGGFACYPVLNEGAKMGIPTLVHESNAIPGRAVRKLSPKIDCVMTNFESTTDIIKNAKRLVRVGNPSLFEAKPVSVSDKLEGDFDRRVISFGGSGGAENLNSEMCRALSTLADEFPRTQFYHAAGKRDYARIKREFEARGLDGKPNVVLVDYIYDMDKRMSGADLVVCRAGAMTISETALLGKAAIFVPSPFVASNHQYKNAKALYDAGAGELVEEREFSSGKLADTIRTLLRDEKRRKELGKNIRVFAEADANDKIYGEIMRLL